MNKYNKIVIAIILVLIVFGGNLLAKKSALRDDSIKSNIAKDSNTSQISDNTKIDDKNAEIDNNADNLNKDIDYNKLSIINLIVKGDNGEDDIVDYGKGNRLQVKRYVEISGVLCDSDNNPLPNIYVKLGFVNKYLSQDEYSSDTVMTNDKGVFQIVAGEKQIPKAIGKFKVHKDGYLYYYEPANINIYAGEKDKEKFVIYKELYHFSHSKYDK